MVSQLLGWNYKEAGPGDLGYPSALISNGSGTDLQGTAPDGASFETDGSVLDQANQRIVRYRGHERFVAVQGAAVYLSEDAGDTWDDVYTDTDLVSTVVRSGLYVVEAAGETRLVFLSKVTTGSYAMFTSEDGESWTKHGPFTGRTNQTMALQSGTIWHGHLFCVAGKGSGGRSYALDLWDHSLSEATLTGLTSNFCDAALCVFNDRLFGLWHKSSGGPTLYEFLPGANAWVERLALVDGAVDAGSEDRKSCLFAQGAHLYAVFCMGSGSPVTYSWKAIQIDTSLGKTDISGVLDPLTVNEATPAAAPARVAVIVDGPAASSGAVPQIYLCVAPNAFVATGGGGGHSTQLAVFQWNGPSTDVTDLGVVWDVVASAWPFGVQYSGNVFWTSGQRVVEQVASWPVSGGVRRSFKLYSPNSSPDNRSVRAFFGRAADEYACGESSANAATLSNPSHGSLSGNEVTGLDAADNGSTTFEVTWLAGSQSPALGAGDGSKLVMELT